MTNILVAEYYISMNVKYITTAQASERWGISQRRIALLCAEGRIYGAYKMGKTWVLPENVEKPSDARINDARSEASFVNESISEQSIAYNSSAVYVQRNLFSNASKICESQQIQLNDVVNNFLEQFIKNNSHQRIGAAEGVFRKYEDIDFCNDEVENLFGV